MQRDPVEIGCTIRYAGIGFGSKLMLLTPLRRLISGRPRLQPLAEAAPSIQARLLPGAAAQEAPHYEGFINELSSRHIHGWVRDTNRPSHRVSYEIILSGTKEVLGGGRADQFWFGLESAGFGDGAHAFSTRFARPLTEHEREQVILRAIGSSHSLARAPNMQLNYEPILHVAMDIVNNCNLRCPFCLYDYKDTRATNLMAVETLDAALRFLPYTKDGEFWFSCLHEPTLHPRLVDFIERVPHDYRRKLFYTTNLAKRMPADYFDWLANSGMHHINVSIESRDPAIYEKMRKGARFRIFQENWDRLVDSLEVAEKPVAIRYIMMAYKSNLREIPALAEYLLEKRQAWQVEVRYTFDAPYIPVDFRNEEFLDEADWSWLAAAVAQLPSDRLILVRPPSQHALPSALSTKSPLQAESQAVLPGRMFFRMSWDGSLKIIGLLARSRDSGLIEKTLLETNILDLPEPETFFDEMHRRSRTSSPRA